jgi:hypothetical protein
MILIKNNIQMVNPFFGVLDQVFQSKDLVVESNLVASMLGEVHVPTEVHSSKLGHEALSQRVGRVVQ